MSNCFVLEKDLVCRVYVRLSAGVATVILTILRRVVYMCVA